MSINSKAKTIYFQNVTRFLLLVSSTAARFTDDHCQTLSVCWGLIIFHSILDQVSLFFFLLGKFPTTSTSV